MHSRAARRTAALAAVVVLLGAWWLTMAPRVVGGPATWLVVDGPSMQPTYDDGDLVVVRAAVDYEVGDAIAFRYAGGRVVHRIVGGDATGGWQTQGDGKPAPDGWTIPDGDVLGVEALVVPGGGEASQWLRTPLGAAAVALVLALFCSLPSRRRPRRTATSQRQLRRTATLETDVDAHDLTPWRPRVPHPVEPALLAVVALVAAGGGITLGLAPLVASGSSTWTVLGVVLLVVAAVVAAPLAGRVLLAWGGDEADKAVATLRGSLVRVASVPDVPTVHVGSMADLRRVATLHAVPVLHVVEPDLGHRFVVLAGGAAYALSMGGAAAVEAPLPAALVDLVHLEQATPQDPPTSVAAATPGTAR